MKNQLTQFAARSRVLLQRLVRPISDFFRWSAKNPPAHFDYESLRAYKPEDPSPRIKAVNEGIAEMNRHIEQLIRDKAPEEVVRRAVNDRTEMIAPKLTYIAAQRPANEAH
jgi:hypothetical protein